MQNTLCRTICVLSMLSAIAHAQNPQGQEMIPIKAELTSRLADVLSKEWNGTPEWATMASGILNGEQVMGLGKGWFKPAQIRHDWAWLRATFDKNPRDGQIQKQELPKAITDQQFAILDRDLDGVVSSRDLAWENNFIMEGYSPSNDVFDRMDLDSNGRLTKAEMNKFFERYADGFDYLTPDDLKRGLRFSPPPPNLDQIRRQQAAMPPDRRWQLLDFLLSGGLGSLSEGPDVNDPAPDFELRLLEKDQENHELKLSKQRVRLSDSRGKRPVVLVFGSFT